MPNLKVLILSLSLERMMDFDCEENLRSLSNKFYYAVLRKAISHSIDIFRMINSQKFSLDFSQAVMCS